MTRALVLLTVLSVLAGCASSTPPPQSPRAGTSPRVRCVSDPRETQTRPLFFLFCIESP